MKLLLAILMLGIVALGCRVTCEQPTQEREPMPVETRILANQMARDLREMAVECYGQTIYLTEEWCAEPFERTEQLCNGTVDEDLREFCLRWEVVTYGMSSYCTRTTMIELAQDIEEATR